MVASATPDVGDAPLDVAFQASVAGGVPPYDFSWSFGDGFFGFTSRPSHIYGPGNFVANVSVNDSVGNHGSATTAVEVAPALNATFATGRPADCGSPYSIAFTSSVSGGHPPYTYLWNFGDGNTSTLPNPAHTFANESTELVSLNVTDATGRHATAELPVGPISCGNSLFASSYAMGATIIALSATGAILTWFLWRRRTAPPPANESAEPTMPPQASERSPSPPKENER